jgi:hypothetical protein
MAEAVRAGAEVYAALRRELADRKLSIGSPLSRLRSRVMFAADRTCRAGSWEAASTASRMFLPIGFSRPVISRRLAISG